MNQAFGEDPLSCPSGCGRSYKGRHRKYNLKYHLKNDCGVTKPQFYCTFCKKQFWHKRSLTFHLTSVHQENKL